MRFCSSTFSGRDDFVPRMLERRNATLERVRVLFVHVGDAGRVPLLPQSF